MKNKLIPIILVILSLILFVVAILLILNTNYFKLSNKTENKDNQTQIKHENSTNKNNQENIEDSTNPENKADEVPIKDNSESSNETEDKKPEFNIENELLKDEISVISYFESEDNSITEKSNQDDSSIREKVKNAFVTVIDFIFYEKKIKGYTFDELTTSAKLKVISIALSIDNKIDKYFPDYKDVIKDKYNNIKGKLAVKYLEFTSSLCENVGEVTCNQAKEDFNTMKESFSITWQLIKELASSGSNKVKEFYESWRDSE